MFSSRHTDVDQKFDDVKAEIEQVRRQIEAVGRQVADGPVRDAAGGVAPDRCDLLEQRIDALGLSLEQLEARLMGHLESRP